MKLLKIFYDVTLNISGSLYVTINVYFQQFYTIKDALNCMYKSNNVITNTMSNNMRSKFNKYWDSTNKFNLMIYIVFVLDQRYKIRTMRFWLTEYKGE